MTKDVISILIGSKAEEIRREKGITQEAVASYMKWSRSSYVNFEAGRQSLSLDKLYKLSEALEEHITNILPTMSDFKKYEGKKIRKVITYEIEE